MLTWTATKIATIVRTNTKYIPTDWTLCPTCEIWPRRRKRAVLWLLAQLVTYRQENYHATKLLDYVDYVRCWKEKLYTNPRRRSLVANYLLVVDEWLQHDVIGIPRTLGLNDKKKRTRYADLRRPKKDRRTR
jgi:hypothetical protein